MFTSAMRPPDSLIISDASCVEAALNAAAAEAVTRLASWAPRGVVASGGKFSQRKSFAPAADVGGEREDYLSCGVGDLGSGFAWRLDGAVEIVSASPENVERIRVRMPADSGENTTPPDFEDSEW
jgi:hypothetical protein